jgi:hypothetical protein
MAPLSRRAAARSAFAVLHSRIAKAAAIILCAAALSYVRFSTRIAPPPDFALLPVTWPSNLLPYQQVPAAPQPVKYVSRARTKAKVEPKKHNVFMRAMNRVTHPLRPSSTNTAGKVSRDPDTN